jgi:hypothetical protein
MTAISYLANVAITVRIITLFVWGSSCTTFTKYDSDPLGEVETNRYRCNVLSLITYISGYGMYGAGSGSGMELYVARP